MPRKYSGRSFKYKSKMKTRTLTGVVALLIALASCNTEKSANSFKVTGDIKGIAGSDIIIMFEDPLSPNGFSIDSLHASSDKFEFEGTIDSVRIAVIAVNNPELVQTTGDEPAALMPVQFFIQPNCTVKITGEVDKMNLCHLSGTSMNEQMNKLVRFTEEQQIYVDSLFFYMYRVEQAGFDTEELQDAIRHEYAKLVDLHADFVEQNPDLDISSFILQMYLIEYYDLEKLQSLYNGLTDKVKSNNYGKTIYRMIEENQF